MCSDTRDGIVEARNPQETVFVESASGLILVVQLLHSQVELLFISHICFMGCLCPQRGQQKGSVFIKEIIFLRLLP